MIDGQTEWNLPSNGSRLAEMLAENDDQFEIIKDLEQFNKGQILF